MSTAVPTTQKSLVLYKESTPYIVAETPVPHPGPKDALNPVDHIMVDPPFSRSFMQSYPFVPGCNAAGVVVQCGTEVTDRKVGDRVLIGALWGTSGAAHQQYATALAELTSIIPPNITFEQAATLPLALVTAVLALYNQSLAPENLSLRLKPVWEPEGTTAYAGTPAFIVGGATSVGQYAIQLARLAGHNPIIATASPHNAPLLKSLGATHVLDRSRSDESILTELPTLTGGKPIEYVLVALFHHGGEPMRLGRDGLAPGGAFALVSASPDFVPEDVRNPGQGKRVGFVSGSALPPFNRDMGVAMFKQITSWLEKGLIKPDPVEVLPNGLAGIPEGLERLKANKVSGKKLVARPQETP
ncbi:GroES-like protein [Trametes cingulata]|nr:GroES-like protein [Trametes cingulata]